MAPAGPFLYHHHSSVCAAKVRVALYEKGLDWDGRLLRLDGDQFDPAYLALNPAAVVPTLVHGDAVVTGSNVILDYLDDAYPDPPLRPDSPGDRARARMLLQRLDEGPDGLHHAASVLTYAVAYRARLIAEAGSDAPDRLTPVIAARMNARSRAWLEEAILRGPAAPAVGAALRRFDAAFADFEAILGGQTWLAGPRYSSVEAGYLPYIIRLSRLYLTALWDRRPALAAWVARITARASADAAVTAWYAPETLELMEREGQAARDAMAARLAETRAAPATAVLT
ncbi:MAG: glutathione S-transferase family protein [Pseudomonadota bacterium]